MYNPTAPPSRSLDVAGTETANAGTYSSPNCRLRLNGQGQPVAIRRVVALQQPGSPAVSRYQVVTPRQVVSLSHNALRNWEKRYAHPAN